MYFLALSQAPPEFDAEIARTPPATSEPASSPAVAWMPNRNPVKNTSWGFGSVGVGAGTGGDRADSQAPWPGGRAGRSRASEPGTAPVRSADLTPSPRPTSPGHRAGTGAC